MRQRSVEMATESIEDTSLSFEAPGGFKLNVEGISVPLLIIAFTVIVIQNHGKIPGIRHLKKRLKRK